MTEHMIVRTVWIFVFLFGIIIGSFLNVCIFRLPEKKDIVFGRSRCLSCGNVLKWYELIPVVSYLLQKGKCRNCGAKLSLQYPLVELGNGLGWLWIFQVKGMNLQSLILSLAFSALLVAAVTDAKTYQIPPLCNGIIGVLGVGMIFMEPAAWLSHVAGIFAVGLPFWLIYFFSGGKAIGGGDVKLMAAAGLLLGWADILLALMLASLAACVIHLPLMKWKGKDRVLAFGPYLAFGICAAMLYGDRITGWYLGTFLGL